MSLIDMKKFGFLWAAAVVLCLSGTVSSCSSTNDTPDEPDPVVPVVPPGPETPAVPTLSEDEASGSLAELVSRCMLAAIAPDAACNDAERLWELMRTVYYQPETRGVWSTAAGLVKFKQAINSANALYRATLLGAMIETGQTDREARQSIWRVIMAAPPYANQSLPNAYRVGCDDFWTSFSRGEFDDAAVFIYSSVISERLQSGDTPAQKVANYLDYHDLYEIKMMLRCAGPIIEAGCNIVFAAGDDLISWGQNAYDFVNNNGKVVLEACKGNLTSETCIDAINTNLKLLTNGLEEVLPDGGDLAGVLADFTADQVKAFNKAVQEALNTAGATRLSPEDVSWFVNQVQDIIGVGMPPSFIDQVFFNDGDMTQLSIESRDGNAYQFFYTDRNGNVLMEGKCAVDNKNISILVDEEGLDPKCDLLPRSGIPQGGIVTIPYHVVNEATLVLWYKSDAHSQKYFQIMNDEQTESFFDELTLGIFVTGGKAGTSHTEVLRATRSNGAVFGRDDISTSLYGDGLWVHGLKDFKTGEGTTLRHKIEFLLDSNNVFDLSAAKRFSYSCWEIDAQGRKTSYWTMYSESVPLKENLRDKAVWLAEESLGNMSVSHLTYRDDKRTVCDTYVPVSGTNRIEISVGKGELPQQLSVSPTQMLFNTEGGQQTLNVKRGQFRYSGCFVEQGEDGGWLTCEALTDSTFAVKALENNTGKGREATLIVWAANEPKYEDIDPETGIFDTLCVKVMQQGRELVPHVSKVSISSLGNIWTWSLAEYDERERKGSYNSTIREVCTIQTERVGNGLHITAKEISTQYSDNHNPEINEWELTLDIPDCTGEKFSDISSLHYYHRYVRDYWDIAENVEHHIDFTVANIPFLSSWFASTYTPGDYRVTGTWKAAYPNISVVSCDAETVQVNDQMVPMVLPVELELKEGDVFEVSVQGTDLRLNPQ